jgi:hypothetical protein
MMIRRRWRHELMIRRVFDELPERVRREIVRRCGPVLGETAAPAGRHSEISTTLRTSCGRVFVKGITVDHPHAGGHRHEVYVNRWLPPVAPRLQWTVETGGWLVLGLEQVDGRHADLSPGSTDLPLIADAVSAMVEALCPCPAQSSPVLAEQWARFAAWRRLRRDPPNDLDPWSLLVLRLIQAGHTPVEAERWAAGIPGWLGAVAADISAFAIAVLGLWEYLERNKPLPHRAELTNAARRWVRHRLMVTA